ncbi:Ionotropic receptor 110 [Blattella germanica]|nr:Ionotropic receptor 110 [Blattella germanica]
MSPKCIQVAVITMNERVTCQLHPNTAGRNPHLIMFYQGSTTQSLFLKKCSEEQQFGDKNFWLFITNQSLTTDLFFILKGLNIQFNSNVFVATQTNGTQNMFTEVYTDGHDLKIEEDATIWENTMAGQTYNYAKIKRFRNLHGHRLTAIAVGVNKFYTEVKKSGNQFQIVGGYFGEVFKTLAHLLNFTYSVKYLTGYAYGNTPTDDNSSWTGIIGYIQRNEADLSACEVSIVGDRLLVMDFSMPVHISRRRLYIHEGIKVLHMDWYFRPFKMSTWCALIICLFFFTLINSFLHHISYKMEAVQRRVGILSNFFTVVTIMLQQGTEYPANMSVRLVLLSCAFMFLVVHVAYSAKLMSLATMYISPPPLQHLDDILKSTSWKFSLTNGSLEYNIFKTAMKDSVLGQIWQQKLEPFPEQLVNDIRSGLLEVLSESPTIFMGHEDGCENTLQNSFRPTEACQVLALPQTYFKGGMGFGLQRKSPYKDIINYSLMKMKSSGILQRLKLEWIPQPKECSRSLQIVTEWLDIVPPLTAYVTMLVLSICILIGEMLLHVVLKGGRKGKLKKIKQTGKTYFK